MSPQGFADAIGLVESQGNPNAPLGDGGRALGRFQMHPDEMWTWAHRLTLAPQLSETWDSFVSRLVVGFYLFHTSLTPVQCAMCWHLGHVSKESDEDWDLDYAERFEEASQKVQEA